MITIAIQGIFQSGSFSINPKIIVTIPIKEFKDNKETFATINIICTMLKLNL